MSADEGEAAFAKLVDTFADDPRVTLPVARRGRFGSRGLRVDGKVFAMCVKGELAVKLAADAVEAALARGEGRALTMGKRVMKAWLVVHAPPASWRDHALRARDHVAQE